jgi:hypothetical protein
MSNEPANENKEELIKPIPNKNPNNITLCPIDLTKKYDIEITLMIQEREDFISERHFKDKK